MKVSSDGDGARIRLTLAEAHVLGQLFGELQELLAPDGLEPSDPVRQRLYPAGYDDPDAAQSFRELTESGLLSERSQRLDECIAELRGARSIRRTEVVLDADATERWLRVLNDLRLTFGTRLDVTEDDDFDLDERDPDVSLKARYVWLTALQDALVRSVMG